MSDLALMDRVGDVLNRTLPHGKSIHRACVSLSPRTKDGRSIVYRVFVEEKSEEWYTPVLDDVLADIADSARATFESRSRWRDETLEFSMGYSTAVYTVTVIKVSQLVFLITILQNECGTPQDIQEDPK